MMQTYRGKITLDEGDEVDVDLELSDDTIRLATEVAEIGTWARADCEIVDAGDGVYDIVVDGDRVSFEPFDEEPFLAGLRPGNGRVDEAGTSDDDEAAVDGEDVVSDSEPDDEAAGHGLAGEDEITVVGDEVFVDVEVDDTVHVFGDDVTEIGTDDDSFDVEVVGFAAGSAVEVEPADAPADSDDDDGDSEGCGLGEPGDAEDDDGDASDVVNDDTDDAVEPDRGSDATDDLSEDTEDAVDPVEEPADAAGAVIDEDVDLDALEAALSELETPQVESVEEATDPESETSDSGGWFSAPAASSSPPPGFEPDDGEPEEEEPRGRFGGSSVERLAAAVGALKSQRGMTPADEAVAAAQAEESESVVESILASQRNLRQTTHVKRFTWELVRKVGAGILLGIGVAAVIVLSPRAWDVISRQFVSETTIPQTQVSVPTGEDPRVTTTTAEVSPATTTAVESPGTTVVPTTSIEQASSIFDRPVADFYATWNAVGGDIESVLRFQVLPPNGDFENEFYPYLTISGEVGEDGTVDSFTLVVDPTGPADSDRIGLQALGVAIKVVDAESTGSSRAALLAALGLDVRSPELAGVNTSIDVDGVRYELRYDEEAVELVFTLSPAPPSEG